MATTNKVITGLAAAIVELDSGAVVPLQRGDKVPSNLKDGQLERLDELGAFLTPLEHHQMMRVTGDAGSRPVGEPVPSDITDLTPEQRHNTVPEGEQVIEPGVIPSDAPEPVQQTAKKSTPRKRAAPKKSAAPK